jgi:hypothetical protein
MLQNGMLGQMRPPPAKADKRAARQPDSNAR